MTLPPQSYRRFQVNFSSPSDAAQFIDAIRPVCPCKENADPPPPQIPTNGLPAPSIQAASASAPLVRSQSSTVRWPSMLPPSLNATNSRTVEKYSQEGHPQRALQLPPQLSSSDLSLAPPPSSDPAPAPAYPTTTAPLEMHSSQFTAQSTRGGRRNSTSGFSLPASSLPASSAATLAPPTQGSTVGTQQQQPAGDKTREVFLESLREVPELYSLTRHELENLVSVIVREPGFTRLVRCLFFSWRLGVWGFLEIPCQNA
jgi:hypothetical protein